MIEEAGYSLSGVAETLLLPLYIRALESQRPDALIKDDRAVALIGQLRPDSSWMAKMKLDEVDKASLILRNREFDRCVRNFLARNPEAVVVHIGCGLDSRFERVDNGSVEWYDLDLPEVIELRRRFIGGETGRYHLLACSVLDSAWLEQVSTQPLRPYLFMAEGVLMYLKTSQVKSLVLTLRRRFPGAELVTDAFSPFIVRMNNLRIRRTNISARYHWALKSGQELESWADGIALLGEWSPLSEPEPRLAHIRWMRHIPFLARALRIFRYRLGQSPE